MPSNPHDERDNAVPASVGIVETRFARLFSDDHPLQFQIGAELASVTVAYETYGTLNANKNNAVYVCHALTGDAHAAGLHSADDEKPGWWDGFIGPGKALDTNEYFVICGNVLGGCQGTTGPGSVDAISGKRFCLDFPFLTVSDIVSVHSELVRHLGIKQLLAVVGGSLGAQALNETVPSALALLAEEERPTVVHQAGEKHLPGLTQRYAEAGVKADCVAFINEMAGAYDWADLVICRSGALTVAELAAAGVASLLVPYPHAVDDHQTSNARFLSNAGAAILLQQNQLTPERLAEIRNLSRQQLTQMAEKARYLARPEATMAVAQACAELVK